MKEIENNLKSSINIEKSKRKESYCCNQENPQILLQIRKKQLNDLRKNWTSPGWRGELGTKQQKNKPTTEWTIQ